MAEGVLGLGSGQAASLNNELIDKLKAAERKAQVEPIETSLTEWDTESEKVTEIIAKANELLETIKPFDLYVTSGVNAFDQKSATTSGDAVVFDAVSVGTLNTGTTSVTVGTLAQRDVYQTDTFADKDAVIVGTDVNDKLTITHGGTDYEFLTDGKTYQEVADSINLNSNFNATVEQVGTSDYRIVIKSAETGLDNALTIAQSGIDLGLATPANHTLTAANLTANVDGVDYNVSSNSITVDGGLKITAVKTGDASINVTKDTSAVEPSLQTFVSKYNELVALVDAELFSAESTLDDKATMRSMMSSIKDKLFGSYGTADDKNLFVVGFEISKTGILSLDTSVFNAAMESDPDGMRELFIGVAEDEGMGTALKEYVDSLDGFDGLLTAYQDNMTTRKTSLEEDKTKAIESLDSKYALLAQQFAAYGNIINQFESSFSGLKLLIQQSTSS